VDDEVGIAIPVLMEVVHQVDGNEAVGPRHPIKGEAQASLTNRTVCTVAANEPASAAGATTGVPQHAAA
jgi:hypothetical protein